MNYFELWNRYLKLQEVDKRLTSSHVSLYVVLFHLWNKSMFKPSIFIHRNYIMSFAKIGSTNTYYKVLRNLHEWGYLQYFPAPNSQYNSSVAMTVFTDEFIDVVCNSYNMCSDPESFYKNSANAKSIQALVLHDSNSIQALHHASIKSDISTDTHIRHIEHIHNRLNKENRIAPTPNNKKNIYSDLEERKKVAAKKEISDFVIPTIEEVETFFTKQGKDANEGAKFFHYYNSNGWVQKNNLPIKNWESTAHKWMLNNFDSKPKPKDFSIHVNTNKSYDIPT